MEENAIDEDRKMIAGTEILKEVIGKLDNMI